MLVLLAVAKERSRSDDACRALTELHNTWMEDSRVQREREVAALTDTINQLRERLSEEAAARTKSLALHEAQLSDMARSVSAERLSWSNERSSLSEGVSRGTCGRPHRWGSCIGCVYAGHG